MLLMIELLAFWLCYCPADVASDFVITIMIMIVSVIHQHQ
jgi:hypothetical protein